MGALSVTGPAHSVDCEDNIYVFSRVSASTPVVEAGNPSVATEAVGCEVFRPVKRQQDTRWLIPGSNSLSVRYFRDLGPSVPTLSGSVSGLGVNRSITLARVWLTALGYVYDSQWIPIDPLVRGTVVVVVNSDLGAEVDQYRTAT
jgi:hypothetical protein